MRRRLLLRLLLAVALPFALAAVFLAWVAGTPSGLRFALAVGEAVAGPGLRFGPASGRLAGPLRLHELRIETAGQTILLDELQVDWRPGRLLGGTLQIDRLAAGRLRIESEAAAAEGQSPRSPPRLILPLALRLESLRIDRLQWAERGADASVELRDVHLTASSDGRRHRLRADFKSARFAAELEAALDGAAPHALSGQAQLRGEQSGQSIAVALQLAGSLENISLSARSRGGLPEAGAEAELTPFGQPMLRTLRLEATDFDPSAWIAGAPRARLDIAARAAPDATGVLAGELELRNRAPGTLDQDRLPLRRLELSFRQAGEGVDLPAYTLGLEQGAISGSGRWDGAALELRARLAGVDAAAFHRALRHTRLSGTLDARLGEEQQSLRADLRDRHFSLTLDALRAGRAISVDRARLAAGQGFVEMSGRLATDGDFELRGRLHELDPAAFAKLPSGRLRAVFDARGQWDASPTATVHFVLAPSRFAGQTLDGRGELLLEPERIGRAELRLAAGDNRFSVEGSLGRPGDRLELRVEAPRLAQLGLSGDLGGRVTVTGGWRQWRAEWALHADRLGLPGSVEAHSLDLAGDWSLGGALALRLGAGRLRGFGRGPELRDLDFTLRGQQREHRIELSAALGEQRSLRLSGSGDLGDDWRWRGEIAALDWRGEPALRLIGRPRFEIAADRLELSRLHLAGADWQARLEQLRRTAGELHSSGRFAGVPAAWLLPAAEADSSLRLQGEWAIGLAERAAGSFLLTRESGDLLLRVGDEVLPLGLDGLRLDGRLNGERVDLALSASGAQAGRLAGSLRVPLQRATAGWTLARHAPLQGDLRLDIPSIAWLAPLAGPNLRLGGSLHADLRFAGSIAVPLATGEASGDDLSLRLVDQGLDLRGGTLRLAVTPETLRLQRLEFVSTPSLRPYGGQFDVKRLMARTGRLIAEGEMRLRDGNSRLGLRADHLVVAQLPDRWVMLSGAGGLRFGDGRLSVDADLLADAAYVELPPAGQPSLSADVFVRGKAAEGTPPRMALDLRLDLGEQTYFRGAGIATRLAGKLRLSGNPAEQLRARGSIHTVGGSFDAYGRELSIERGILNFNGLLSEPGLNVRALRRNLPVEAGVEVSGSLSDPQLRLVSTPDVPDAEKLSWMVLGRPPGKTLGGQDAELLLSAAMALRSNNGRAPLQSLMRGLGLDELSITSGSTAGGSRFPSSSVAGSFTQGTRATVTEQIATVGKRIGDRTVIAYERSLTSAENVVRLTFDLTRRLALIGRVGASSTLSLMYTFAFGGVAADQPVRPAGE